MTVLSVRVRKELLEEARKLGIDIRSVIERALEEEVKKRKKALLDEALRKTLESMNVSAEEWISAVRESKVEG